MGVKIILFFTCIFTYSSFDSRFTAFASAYDTNKEITTTLDLQENYNSEINDPHTNYFDSVDESEYVSNYWDCSTQSEILKQKNLIEINQMLNRGQHFINETEFNYTDVVLVLGNAGVGKTTLVQFMAGDNRKLISKEVRNGSGEYLIEDGIKIGSSLTESFTMFPELVNDESEGITYCDTPGFSDTRSPNHVILASYLMKSYLKNIKRIKIILLVPYSSVQFGMDKDGFINTLRNLNNLIKSNIDNYKHSFVLVATKVPNNYVVKDNKLTLIPDEYIINSITDYIKQIEKSIDGKLKKISDKEEKQFFKNSLKLLTSLTETNEDGKFSKINIFRRPSVPGPLSEISLLQDSKKSLKSVIKTNTEFSKLYEEDIGYALSDTAKNHMICLLNYINDKIIRLSENLFEDLIKSNYENKTSNHDNIYKLVVEQKESEIDLVQLKRKLDDSKTLSNYSNILQDFLKTKNITHVDNIFKFYENEFVEMTDYLSEIQKFYDNHLLNPVTWSNKIEPLIKYIKDSSIWYEILIKLYEYFSSYEIQNSVLNFTNDIGLNKISDNSSIEEKEAGYKFMLSNSNFLPAADISSYFNKAELNSEKINELEEVISLTLKSSTKVECNGGKLIIFGHFIKISDFNEREKIRFYCGDDNFRVIVIKARQTVFIDEDLKGDLFKGVDVVIIAPTWQIIGVRKIKIDGKDGSNHQDLIFEKNNNNIFKSQSHKNNQNFKLNDFFSLSEESAYDTDKQITTMSSGSVEYIYNKLQDETSRPNEETVGLDGLPGNPGGNGGIFFGIGVNFVNGNLLTVTSNGGNGGSGQDGRTGKNGYKGKDGSEFIEMAISGHKTSECYSFTWESGVSDYRTAISKPILNKTFTSSQPHNWKPTWISVEEQYVPNPSLLYMEKDGCITKTDTYICKGKEGSTGGKGGNGGWGGFGGNAGKIQVNELGGPSGIKFENITGNNGTSGKGGSGGKGGDNGSTVSCFKTSLQHSSYRSPSEFWRCFENVVVSNSKQGLDGLSNSTIIGILKPSKRIDQVNYYSDVLSYVLDVQKYKNSKFLSSTASKFTTDLIKKWFDVNVIDLWKYI